MNKLALILGLSISMSAHAWVTIDDDTIVGFSAEEATLGDPMTFKDVEDRLIETQPDKVEWCKLKGGIAAGVINDRADNTKEEILDTLSPLAEKIPHFMWVDLQRIVNQSRQINNKGEWVIGDSDDDRIEQVISEYQHCVVNGF